MCWVLFHLSGQKSKFFYRKFPLPPLLGPTLDEKTCFCSGPNQLPTLWPGTSSSHLLPAIVPHRIAIGYNALQWNCYQINYQWYIFKHSWWRLKKSPMLNGAVESWGGADNDHAAALGPDVCKLLNRQSGVGTCLLKTRKIPWDEGHGYCSLSQPSQGSKVPCKTSVISVHWQFEL